MYAMPERASGISAVRQPMYSGRDAIYRVSTEVLIGKALNILSLVGYFHRAALV